MTCKQFQENLGKSLLRKTVPALSEDMQAHVATCGECQAYQSSLLAVHVSLFEIPRQLLPEGLAERLKSIDRLPEEHPVRLSWKPDIQRADALLSLALVMILAGWLFNGMGVLVQFGVLTLGLTILISNILKPAFIGRNVNAVAD
jgi:hypothetical protein